MLEYEIENLDDVDEAHRSLYKKGSNGKYQLQISGIKPPSEFEAIQTALTKERSDHKDTKVKLQDFDKLQSLRMNPTEILAKMDKFEELEAAAGGKLDDEKIEELAEKRAKTKVAPVQRELDDLKIKFGEAETQIGEFQQKETTRTIHDAVRKAATESKVVPSALEDILMIADRVFEVSESGEVVTRDGVGVTPSIDPMVYFTDMQEKRPHWWPNSQGGGANGSGNGGAGIVNPWTKDNWNMMEQGKIFKRDQKLANQLAAQAGSKIGGTRPQS